MQAIRRRLRLGSLLAAVALVAATVAVNEGQAGERVRYRAKSGGSVSGGVAVQSVRSYSYSTGVAVVPQVAVPRVQVQYQAVAPAAGYSYSYSAGFRAPAAAYSYSVAPSYAVAPAAVPVPVRAFGSAGTSICPGCGGTIDNATGQHVTFGPAAARGGAAYVDPQTGAVYPINPQTGGVYQNPDGTAKNVNPNAKADPKAGDEWKPSYSAPAPQQQQQQAADPPQPQSSVDGQRGASKTSHVCTCGPDCKCGPDCPCHANGALLAANHDQR